MLERIDHVADFAQAITLCDLLIYDAQAGHHPF